MSPVGVDRALRATDRSAALGRVQAWSLLAAVAVVSAIAIWVISPRFELDVPSLVDDWAAIDRSEDQLGELASGQNPESERFRPSWIAWNYVQWHTFDAPEGVVGPNAWNLLRLIVFVAGLSLLTALALPRPRRTWDAVLFPVLAALPAFLVLVVPKFARDFARLGTQEPLLIGAMALGGSLLVLAARALLAHDRRAAPWPIGGLAIAGSALWLVGAYQKEASVCVLPLLAAAAFAGRARLASWPRLHTRRRIALAALAAVTLLPLVHVGIEIVHIASRGDLVYGTEVDAGRGIVRGVEILYDRVDEVMTADGHLMLFAAVALTLLATVVRRRVDVLAAGALGAGVLTFLFAAQSGVSVSRYYIPVYALFAVALALSIARLPRVVQLASLAWIALAFVPAPGVRAEVAVWVGEERPEGELVTKVAELAGGGCTVATGGLDIERHLALPVLVALERRAGASRCARANSRYFVLGGGPSAAILGSACAPGSLEHLLQGGESMGLYRCDRLRGAPVDHPLFGTLDPATVVALHRLSDS